MMDEAGSATLAVVNCSEITAGEINQQGVCQWLY